MKKKIIHVIAAMLAACLMLSGCGNKKAESDPEVKNVTVTETESEPEPQLPEGDFYELPDEALDDFDYLTAALKKMFPDAAGKLMYGFRGEQTIATAYGEISCYMFDYYSFKKNEYTKIAVVAKDIGSDIIYLFDEVTGRYTQALIEEPEKQWHEIATAALMIDVADAEELAPTE